MLPEERRSIRGPKDYAHKSRVRTISTLSHYAAEVGDTLALAYGLLDDASWPSKPLVKVRFRDLDKYDRFLTVHTHRRGIRIGSGALLIRGDGTVEECEEFHDELVVLT